MISLSHWGLFQVHQREMSPAWYEERRNGTAWEIVFGPAELIYQRLNFGPELA